MFLRNRSHIYSLFQFYYSLYNDRSTVEISFTVDFCRENEMIIHAILKKEERKTNQRSSRPFHSQFGIARLFLSEMATQKDPSYLLYCIIFPSFENICKEIDTDPFQTKQTSRVF